MTQKNAPLQVLTPDGQRVPNRELDPVLADIDTGHIIALYNDMRRVRRFDEEAFALTRQGELTLWSPLLGQEAAQVGSFRALNDNDWIFASYREHAAPLLRGARLQEWLNTWKAHSYASWNPHELKIANFQIIIGAQSLHAVGYGMAAKYKKLDDISVTYFGDGATSEGDVNEALVFASAYKTPTVFICQNNGYAISEPVSVQADYPLYWRARGFDIPSMQVDGNDVLAMLASTKIAADRARNGGGSTFIEAVTYRVGPHTTTDDPTKYRDRAEEESWRKRDPILRLEHYLSQLVPDFAEVKANADRLADDLAAQVRESVTKAVAGDPAEMFDHVYVTETKRITKQRDQHRLLMDSLRVE